MNRTILACTMIAGANLLGSAALLTAGPLAPPVGPVASTYKTLTEVEPRTPISSGSFVITQPGSYYLTTSIAQPLAPGVTGILVATSNVTIDLNGFTLSGGQTGIELAGSINNITIRNGTIRNTSGSGIFASGLIRATGVTVRDVRMDAITDAALIVGDRAVIENVHVVGAPGSTTSNGISVGATSRVSNSSAQSFRIVGFNIGPGSAVEACLAANNSGPGASGFLLGTGTQASRCVSRVNAGDGFSLDNAAVAIDCTSSSNTGVGFRLASNAKLDRCNADANVDAGVAVLSGSSHQVIERSSFTRSATAIRAVGANSICIRQNTIRGPVGGLVEAKGVTLAAGDDDAVITNNVFAYVFTAVETNANFGIITNNTLNVAGGFFTSTGSAPNTSNFIGPLLGSLAAASATNPFANIKQ